ncbi:DUF2336 domain-containing protein [Pacificimonas sp. WHA3]|uniref:DUF2336 domain-containing protein n=1 Tax=Pacificimonas pallii TaxID=2827236 RepID=A0ABS6SGF7_9SPHN|nr:DUF2336 domain-containing protein [Pacificimonas pallii]MBV7256922.1 DUF2336 domain-containing protein [Pacificimonas pallii]
MVKGMAFGAGAARLAAAPARSARATRQHVDALFSPQRVRVSDELRALSLSCLSALLSDIAEDLSALAQQRAADTKAVLRQLEDGAFVQQPEIASALLHRAEDHQVEMRLRRLAFVAESEITSSPQSLIDRCAHDEDSGLARLAELYRDARGGRIDKNQQPVLNAAELPDALASALVWQVAGALANGANAAESRAWHDASRRLNARRDVSQSVQHRAARLAVRLDERGELDSALLIRALGDADPVLAAAIVAVKAKITLVTAWTLLFREDVDALLALLLALGCEKSDVSRVVELLLRVSRLGDEPADVAAQAAAVELEIGAEGLAALLDYWRLDPAFRAVLEMSSQT